MFKCKVCGGNNLAETYVIKEMYFGTRDEFDYNECGKCGCLQISKCPNNLNFYYPSEYYSKKNLQGKRGIKLLDCLSRSKLKAFLGEFSLIGSALNKIGKPPRLPQWISLTPQNLEYSILDVGSGSGRTLLKLRKRGFINLTGIDPYIDSHIFYKNGVTIHKRTMDEIDGEFDYIMLNHSLEHIPDQKRAFENLHRLLKKNRYILIRIPTVSSYAWRHYRENWVQLDAPRHLFLHSVKSLKQLAEKNGFELMKVVYDSTEFQFVGSEQYVRNLPLKTYSGMTIKNTLFSQEEINEYRKKAEALNQMNDGDQACFILYKS